MPERIQQRRTKGWRKPENTVSVARPGRYGNPFRIGHTYAVVDSTGVIVDFAKWRHLYIYDSSEAVDAFAKWVAGRIQIVSFHRAIYQEDIRELRGKNLMCFCPLDQPCHADVLLELANRTPDDRR